MGSFQNLAGQRYGRLLVTGPHDRSTGRTTWACLCDCGRPAQVNASSLRRGLTESCGCLRTEITSQRSGTHGFAGRGGKRAPEYNVWAHMRRRCQDPTNKSYFRYGGRGITVCDRWQRFEPFYEDMGPRPTPQHSIDRIDNDGPYDPGNCRWATAREQASNTRRRHTLTLHGRTQSVTEWAREVGLSPGVILHRLRTGWSTEQTLTTPLLRIRHKTT